MVLVNVYCYYFWSLIYGNFGVSSINGFSIGVQLSEVFSVMITLCLLAFLLALLFDIPLKGVNNHRQEAVIL